MIITVIVILVNSGYYRTIVTDSYLPLGLLIIFSIYFLLSKSKKNNKYPSKKTYLGLLLAGILFSILFNFTVQNVLSGGRVAATLICGFILVYNLDIDKFIRTLSGCIRVIIVLSLFFFLLESYVGTFNLPRIGDYYDLCFVTARANATRAHGVFWEPGVFSSVILMTLILNIYLTDRKTKARHIFLYVLGVLMTKSTAGYLILFVLLIGFLWKKGGLNKRRGFDILFTLCIGLLAIFYEDIFLWLSTINPTVFSKLIEIDTNTLATRLNGPLINLTIFFQKPLFGWGFTNAATQFSNYISMSGYRNIVAQTSTSTQILSSIGFLGLAYTIAFFSPLFHKSTVSDLYFVDKVIIAFCMLLIVNKEPHLYSVITWMLMFYLIQKPSRAVATDNCDRLAN